MMKRHLKFTLGKLFLSLLFSIFFYQMGYAQSFSVSGTVSDEAGLPLPGASVTIKNTTNGTIADADGKFSLSVTTQNPVLSVSFIGYKTADIVIGSERTFAVKLEEDGKLLDEFVLIGYGTQQRKAVSTAVTKVTSEDFNQGNVGNALDLVQGKVAGLQVTRSGGNNPNGGVAIQLRGISSITGSLSPLIVIDGIPGGNLDLLQQNDIESFDVLKDGAAAAIYGTRGTNGVILITTKKGKSGKSTFNYTTQVSRDFVNSRPDFLTAAQFRQAIENGVIGKNNDLGATTDIFQELINKNNLTQYHNFVASGGGQTGSYRASLYYKDSEGIALENGREEFGIRGSFNQAGLNNKLTFASSIALNINDANLLGGGQFGIVTDWNPTAPIMAEPGGVLNNRGKFGFYQPENGYNPFSEYKNRINQRQQYTLSGDARLAYEVLPGLVGAVFGSYQGNIWNDRQYRSTEDYSQVNSNFKGTGYAYKANRFDYTRTVEPTVTYNKTLGQNTFELLGGYSYQYSTREEYGVNNSGFTTDGFKDWNLGAGNAITDVTLPRPGLGSFKEDNTLIAYFSRISYSLYNRYFLQASVRHEGSSKFGANNKWATFPAVSAAWVLSDEAFMKELPAITNLKLRVGYGITGNQGIPNYQSIVTLGTGGKYPIFLGDAPVYFQTYGPVKNPNPDLKWETKKEFNFGIDFGLFANKFTGAIDIYSRNTEDLLLSYDVPQPPFVRSSIYTNVGDISNNGIELALSYKLVRTKDFSWNIDLVGSHQTNKIDKLSNQVYAARELFGGGIGNPGNLGDAIRNTEGGPVGNFYGKRFAGFTREGRWLFYKADGSVAEGSAIVEADKAIIGNGLPKYYASLTNNFRYKGFDLTVFFRGKFDYDILNTVDLFYGNKNLLPGNVLNSALNQYSQIKQAPQYSDYYLENGDFVKLDNVTLGYSFNMRENKLFSSIRVFGSARNLATFTGYTGRDPEVQDTGLYPGIDDRNFYPRTITATAGININF